MNRSPVHRSARPGRTAKVVLCLAAFVAAATAAYLVGRRQFDAPTRYAATAIVRQQAPARDNGHAAALPAARAVIAGITADANLRAALERVRHGRVEVETLAAVRADLRVTARTPAPGRLEVAIARTALDADEAMRLVNALAEGYASGQHAAAEDAARREHERAQTAAAAARQDLAAALARRDRWFDQSQPQQPAPVQPAPAPTPRMIENPQWIDVTQRLERLAAAEEELLVDRTPAHPEVRQVNEQIAELEHRLASLPRQIIDESAAAAVPEVASSMPAAVAADRTELRALEAAVALAEADHEAAVAVERRARQTLLTPAGVFVLRAERCETLAPARPPRRLYAAALLVGALVAAAVGLAAFRLGADRPFTSVEQARAALPVPIVAILPREA